MFSSLTELFRVHSITCILESCHLSRCLLSLSLCSNRLDVPSSQLFLPAAHGHNVFYDTTMLSPRKRCPGKVLIRGIAFVTACALLGDVSGMPEQTLPGVGGDRRDGLASLHADTTSLQGRRLHRRTRRSDRLGVNATVGESAQNITTLYLAVVLPKARRIDIPWLTQVHDTIAMGIRQINTSLQSTGARWRLDMETVGIERLSWPINENHSVPSDTDELFRELSDYNSQSILFGTLDALQSRKVVSFLAIQSDAVVRVVGPMAAAVTTPVVTTDTNHVLRSRSAAYPTLLRASMNDTWLYVATKDILYDLRWKKVSLLYAINSDTAAGETFSNNLEQISFHDISIKPVVYPVAIGTNLSEKTKEQMREIKWLDIRIIVVRVSHTLLPLILDYAQEIGIIGVENNYAWVFLDMLVSPCQYPTQMWPVFDGAIVVRPYVPPGRLCYLAEQLHGKEGNCTGTAHHSSPSNSSNCSSQCDRMDLQSAYAYDATLAIGNALQTWSGLDRLLPPAVTSPESYYRGVNLSTGSSTTQLAALPAGKNLTSEIFAQFLTGANTPIVDRSAVHYDVFVSTNQAVLRPIGRWSQENFTLSGFNESLVPNNKSLFGDTLRHVWHGRFPLDHSIDQEEVRVLVYPYKPFIYPKPGVQVVKGLEDLSGPLVSVWKNITSWYGINYTLTMWSDIGKGESLTTLLRKDCLAHRSDRHWDVILGGMSKKRKGSSIKCLLSETIFQSQLRISYRRPELVTTIQMWEAFRPLSLGVWLGVLITLIVAAGVLAILDKKGLATERRGHIVPDAIFMSFTTFLGFPEHNSQVAFARIFILCLQFMCCVIVALYTAGSTNILQDSEHTDNGYKSASSPADFSGKKVGYVPGTDSGIFISDLLGATNPSLVPYANFSQDKVIESLRSKKTDMFFSSGLLAKAIAANNCDIITKEVRTHSSGDQRTES
ncbi:uncharacterized protein LOC135830904 isoform X2 [Sycon ciliatum]|uniref:uncharacterized protein LOC135830904 isoform X2 n=1 Tax=Sycon ciliatum TaxID=27933 RepID=UPI0031F60402